MLSVAYQEFIGGYSGYKGKGSTGGGENKKKLEAFGKLFISFTGNKKVDLHSGVNQLEGDTPTLCLNHTPT